MKFYVEMIDSGCDCCSYDTVAGFDTFREAKEFIENSNDPENYTHNCDADPEEIGELQDTIQRVRELHKPIPHPYQEELQLCSHCGNEIDGSWVYPCPTIKALDGEQA